MIKDGTAEFIAIDARAAAIFDLIYPIGSVFATTGNAPARGTWEEIAKGRTLQGADANHAAETTIAAGLPNITASKVLRTASDNILSNGWEGALGHDFAASDAKWYNSIAFKEGSTENNSVLKFDASRSNSIYGKSNTVQPPAYVVHFYRRIA